MLSKNSFEFKPIGIVRSCFQEKFGVARQSLMLKEATGTLELYPGYEKCIEHLEGFSHLWIIYVFHKNIEKGWTPTIEPPRLDGPKKVGVFASRSPHRPNPIGISCLKLEKIETTNDNIKIHLSGLDILDGTPVLDIKPYLSFADSVPEAQLGWANKKIPKYAVSFSEESLKKLSILANKHHPRLKELLVEMLELDPRPTSQKRLAPIEAAESQGRRFAFRLFDFDVQWQIQNHAVHVSDLVSLSSQ